MTRSYQYLIITGLLLLLGLGAPAAAAAGASALDGYDYYQTIEYAACDQEIYQQDIVVHRTTGTAYEETVGTLRIWHIYVGDHCREDYGDVRFTNSTGAELAYYLWPDYDSSSARFTVRLEGADSTGMLMVWYGNPTATTTSSLQAYNNVLMDAVFAFTSGSGSTVVDQTGVSGNCNIVGATWVPGRIGNAISFDGNDYAIGSTSLPGVTSSVTVIAWVKTTAHKSQIIIQKYIPEDGWMLITNPTGVVGIHGRDGSGQYRSCNSVTDICDGVWHLVVGTIDGQIWRIYIDGVLENTLDTTYAYTNIANPSAYLKIGAHHDNTTNFTGQVDAAAVSPNVLSSGEIEQLASGTWDVVETSPRNLLVRAYSATPPTATKFIVVKEPEVPPPNLEDYQYTKTYYIHGSSDGDLDNYQIKITLHNTTGYDSGSDVYLGSGTVQPDYDDVVFVDQYGVPIPHGYLSFTGSSAETWVRIPSIPAGSRIPIYIHYGNATIAGRDSLHDVFLLYEPWDGKGGNQVATAGDVAISTLAGKYEAWPGIARDPDTGTMWVIYRTSDSNTHTFDSTGRVVVRKSEDDGATWGPEVIVSDIPGVDDRNAAISWVDNDGVGTLIAAYATYASDGAPQYTFVKTSTDGGVTWGPAIPVQAGQARTPYGPCGMNSQGDLWICTYNQNGVFYDVSADGGETWAEYVVSNGYGSETAIIETKTNGVYSGGMLAVIRDNTAPCSYYITRSSDYGRTWDAVTQTEVFPSPYRTPVYLFRTSDDYILLAYTDTSLNLRIYQSYDEGLHWDYKGIVVSGQSISYYPAITQINDSTLYVVWCTNADGSSDVYGNYVEYPLKAQWAITSTPPTTLTVNNGYLTIGNTGYSIGNINQYISSIETFGADTALIINEKSNNRTTQMGYGIYTYPTRGNFAGFIPYDISSGIPFISRSGTTGTFGSPYSYNPSTFSRYEVIRNGSTSVILTRNQISSVLTTNVPTGTYPITIGNGYHGGGGLTDRSYLDYVAVRKVTANEPVHGVKSSVSFTYTVDGPELATGVPIRFQGLIPWDATSWRWYFGDGATSEERNPTHSYSKTGTYRVTLTATNEYGSTSFSQNLHVFAGTIADPTLAPTISPGSTPTLNSSAFRWDPETGYYTSYWFNRDSGFIDVHGLFFSLMLPLTQIFGSWVFLIIWGTLCMGLYLYTQDTTMPFIVGILGGAMMAFLMGEDGLVVMLLTMAFAGGGILAKVLLGRV